jgi:hypothetical protein
LSLRNQKAASVLTWIDVVNSPSLFEGLIQQRYGLAKDQVRKDVDAWLNSQP